MSMKPENQQGRFDVLKWAVVFCLLAAVIVGNTLYAQVPLTVRFTVAALIVAISLLIILYTKKGRSALAFARESRVELRKVKWPTRQESLQMTLMVAVVTLILALILWGIDAILVRLVTLITRLRF